MNGEAESQVDDRGVCAPNRWVNRKVKHEEIPECGKAEDDWLYEIRSNYVHKVCNVYVHVGFSSEPSESLPLTEICIAAWPRAEFTRPHVTDVRRNKVPSTACNATVERIYRAKGRARTKREEAKRKNYLFKQKKPGCVTDGERGLSPAEKPHRPPPHSND